jgi:rubrerythrin
VADPTREERLTASRVALAVQQWPTMDEAFGCLDCHFLFRQATNHVCPLCGSASVMDFARFTNRVGFNAIETTADLQEIKE